MESDDEVSSAGSGYEDQDLGRTFGSGMPSKGVPDLERTREIQRDGDASSSGAER